MLHEAQENMYFTRLWSPKSTKNRTDETGKLLGHSRQPTVAVPFTSQYVWIPRFEQILDLKKN